MNIKVAAFTVSEKSSNSPYENRKLLLRVCQFFYALKIKWLTVLTGKNNLSVAHDLNIFLHRLEALPASGNVALYIL